jgi:TonB family protein
MKSLFLSQIKLSRPKLLSVFSLTTLILSVCLICQTGQAQQVQLSLADILIGLRSKKVTLPERNKLLTEAVRTRGITFTLTPEIETELQTTGADSELVDAIRQKNVRVKVALVPKPTPAPSPVATPTPTPAPDFAFYRKRADESILKGEYDSAVNDYNKAIELNPKDEVAYLNRGRAYHNKTNYDLAIADFDKAIEINPKDLSAYLNRGDAFEKKGSAQQAIGDYKKVVELDANNEAAKNNLKRLQPEPAPKTTLPPPTPKEPEKTAASVAVNETSSAPQMVELGQLNSLALKLAVPVYPQVAQKLNVQGKVTVQITLDEEGKVVSAKAVNGPGMLRAASEDATRNSKFKPTIIGNRAVKATGFVVYNFVTKQ